MASLTTNISSVSLTVSGTTQQSSNISWTLPSVPSGATISSCVLTGTATASMSKGSATIQVNGTTVSSGSSFTIDLGTSNTTSSVSATAVGGNKNASGTVTFSNLVYTVTYSEPVQTYTVTFVDWDGTVLKTEEVESGKSAAAPSNPSRDGYVFTGWDISYANVLSNLTVTAQYEQLYTVTFVDYDGTVLKTEEVRNGESAIAPDVTRDGYELIGWSVDFSNVTSNITTTAQYKLIPVLEVKENGNWINIGEIYKKVSGNWVKQDNESWNDLFDSNMMYARKGIIKGVLYSSGILVLSNNEKIDSSYGNVVCTYTLCGTDIYTTFSEVPWDDNSINIKTVYIDNISPMSTAYWFSICNYITNIYFNNFNTSNVVNMSSMFDACFALTSLDVSNFNTSNVTDMHSMFSGCSKLTTLDVSNFNTSNVTNMNGMFSGCSKLTSLDVSNFDTSNVTDMYFMFNDCSSLTTLDVSNFNTSNVTDMNGMFYDCSSLTTLDVSNFNTSNVTSISNMFWECSNLTTLDLSNFDTSNVTHMSYMFYECSNLKTLDLSNFDTSSVTHMNFMFYGCSSLETLDISSFDIDNVYLNSTFSGCTNPNLTIYVKDEATKTKIESSSDFPSTATVVIGSMN